MIDGPMYGEDPEYWSAAVCRRGHAVTSMVEHYVEALPERCAKCGSPVLKACGECGYRIRGGRSGFSGGRFEPPDFCDRCGSPHPWLSREGRLYLLQNILDEANVPEAEKLRAREQLEELTNPELDEDEQAQRWARFKKAAPTVWTAEQAQRIIGTIVEAGTRAMIERYAP
jgi:hypothetical protein